MSHDPLFQALRATKDEIEPLKKRFKGDTHFSMDIYAIRIDDRLEEEITRMREKVRQNNSVTEDDAAYLGQRIQLAYQIIFEENWTIYKEYVDSVFCTRLARRLLAYIALDVLANSESLYGQERSVLALFNDISSIASFEAV